MKVPVTAGAGGSPVTEGKIRTVHDLSDWLAALAAAGWKSRRAGGEWSGPCPGCGGRGQLHIRAAPGGPVMVFCIRSGASVEASAGGACPVCGPHGLNSLHPRTFRGAPVAAWCTRGCTLEALEALVFLPVP